MEDREELVEQINDLSLRVEALIGRSGWSDSSPMLGELFGALAKAQSEMRVAGKSSNNPFFKSKYADLAAVVEASRQYLAKNGLSVMQSLGFDKDNKRIILTILGHSSGQYIISRMFINPAKEDIQSLGSTVTYLRRYAYAALVGVVADDEDDDGEAAMKHAPSRNGNGNGNGRSVSLAESSDKMSVDHVDMLKRKLKDRDALHQSILKHYTVAKIEDIPDERFYHIYDRVCMVEKEENEAKKSTPQ